jgi:hypothetical protein
VCFDGANAFQIWSWEAPGKHYDEIHALLQAAIPDTAAAMTKLATSPTASATNHLKAAELLLRIVQGPSTRTPTSSDVDAAD